ncbi:MAG: 4-(cytidine 5'-diphospho)-2-C-methyl-D-erythritol kinase [Clostridia bacterium]|nr:4-(cytidine 5'-diphospho)-2-C-methyl-D-erythritol kinase [Clostridia bacterium]
MKLTVDAAAKINLSLDITGTLENGYHSLFMIMQSVSLCDTVILELTDSGTIELTCDEENIPCDRRNSAFKAALMFFTEAGVKNRGLKIHIEKRIPFCAGLAGGSADAAAVIAGLDALYETGLCQTALCNIGHKVGSDVPFCLTGGTKLVENSGEKITPLPAFPDCFIVLAKPEQGVSTAAAYAEFDGLKDVRHPDNEAILQAMKDGDYDALCRHSANVFEQVVRLPEFTVIRETLDACGADLTRMSGSGPTMFGLFKSFSDAERAERELRTSGACGTVCLCKPVASGVSVR